MIRAKLYYQIFGKKYQTDFPLQSKNPTEYDEAFRFDFQSKKNASGEIIYSGTLGWESTKRPPVGLKLLQLVVELDNFEKDGPYIVFQHGYQSWSFSTTYSPDEKDISPILQFLRTSQENSFTKHSGKKGDFQSEGFTVLWSSLNAKGFLLGVSALGEQNVKIRTKLSDTGNLENLDLIFDI
jgi:alpha-galactosidase